MEARVVQPAVAEELTARFAADGAVVAREVLSADELAALAAGVEQNLAAPSELASDYTPAGRSGRFFGDYVNWQRIDGFRRLATRGPLPPGSQRS